MFVRNTERKGYRLNQKTCIILLMLILTATAVNAAAQTAPPNPSADTQWTDPMINGAYDPASISTDEVIKTDAPSDAAASDTPIENFKTTDQQVDPQCCNCYYPDLTVTDIWWSPTSPVNGNSVTITARISNIQAAANAYTGTWGAALFVDGTLKSTTLNQPTLGPGYYRDITFPALTFYTGSHTIRVVSDYYNQVSESDESNNERTETMSVGSGQQQLMVQTIIYKIDNTTQNTFDPKPTITLISGSGPTNHQTGYTNNGAGLYWWYDSGYYNLNSQVRITAKERFTTSGKIYKLFYYMIDGVRTDIPDATTDTSLTITINQYRSIWFVYGELIYPTITNIRFSTITTSGPNYCYADIYSRRGIPTVNEVIKDPSSTTIASGAALYSGTATNGVYRSSSFAAAQCGTYTCQVTATAYGLTTTQTGSTSVNSCSKPDLTVTDIYWVPSSPVAGSSVTIYFKVKNIGNAVAWRNDNQGSGFLHNFYLNGAITSSPWQGTAMNPGDEVAYTAHTFTPASAATYTLMVVADATQRIDESDESNNARTESMTVGTPGAPDLIVEDIWWNPASPVVGNWVQISARVRNQGTAASGVWSVANYINGNLDVAGNNYQSLAAGAYQDVSFGSRQYNTGGTYNVHVIADYLNQVVESNENNNDRTEYMIVGSPPSGLTISINSGATYATSPSVTLSLYAYGATECHYNNDGGVWSAWEPYTTTKAWTLNSGDGTHTVGYICRNSAGETSAVYDSIILDTGAPYGLTILINGGAAYTTSTSATLTLNAFGASECRYNNEGGAWSAWSAYTTSKAWTLTAGDGTKTVGYH
ncbi:Uncharacterised protein [uncultured archaeon]|nr:Uncharacterised protein [uncultured archaeon]